MLEVIEKADRLHVEEPMRRSMGEASPSSRDDSSIRFNEVLHALHLRSLFLSSAWTEDAICAPWSTAYVLQQTHLRCSSLMSGTHGS